MISRIIYLRIRVSFSIFHNWYWTISVSQTYLPIIFLHLSQCSSKGEKLYTLACTTLIFPLSSSSPWSFSKWWYFTVPYDKESMSQLSWVHPGIFLCWYNGFLWKTEKYAKNWRITPCCFISIRLVTYILLSPLKKKMSVDLSFLTWFINFTRGKVTGLEFKILWKVESSETAHQRS